MNIIGSGVLRRPARPVIRRVLVPLAVGAVLASLAVPAGQASAAAGLASARLAGEVVKVAPEPGGPQGRPASAGKAQTLLRLPGGTLTPVSGLDGVPAGARAEVTVQVPRQLDRAVGQVAGGRALAEARDQPAAEGSPLAAAVAAVAASRDLPLPAAASATVTSASDAGTPQPQTLTIAVAGVNGFAASAYSDAVIASMVGSASVYWSGQTGSAVTFTQSGPVTRYTSAISCMNSTALWNEAAARTGFGGDDNDHLVVLVPRAAYEAGYCSYGLGTVGSSVSSGGLVYVADTSWPALAHELGHNMSLMHANELRCGGGAFDSRFSDGEPDSSLCSVAEYADGFDVMGLSAPDSTGNLSSIGLARLGVLPAARVQQVTAGGLTILTLPALSTSEPGTGIRAAAVTDPRNGDVYYLENRQPAGRDLYGWQGLGTQSWAGKTTGYGLRVLKEGVDGASVLLDPTPSASSVFDPVAIVPPGSTFTSASGGLRIAATQNLDGTVTARVALAATGAVPDPAVGAPPDGTSLAQPVITASAPALAAGRTARVAVQVTGDGTAATGTVHVLGAHDEDLGSATLTLGTAVVAVPSPGPGTHTLTVVYDGDGAVSAGTTSITLVVSRYASRVRVSVSAATKRQAATVRVTVLSPGGVPAGLVRLIGSRSGVLASATLESGTARLGVPRGTNLRQAIQVVYSGSTAIAPSLLTIGLR